MVHRLVTPPPSFSRYSLQRPAAQCSVVHRLAARSLRPHAQSFGALRLGTWWLIALRLDHCGSTPSGSVPCGSVLSASSPRNAFPISLSLSLSRSLPLLRSSPFSALRLSALWFITLLFDLCGSTPNGSAPCDSVLRGSSPCDSIFAAQCPVARRPAAQRSVVHRPAVRPLRLNAQ